MTIIHNLIMDIMDNQTSETCKIVVIEFEKFCIIYGSNTTLH